jgi:hypothetical protein
MENLRSSMPRRPYAKGLRHLACALPQAKLSRNSKPIARGGIRQFESFSIGAGWCQAAFRLLRQSDVGCHPQGPRFSSGSALGPPMMGSGGCGGPIYRGVLAVRLTAGIGIRNGLASSIVPAGTSLHQSAEFAFSPVGFLWCTTRCEMLKRHKCALTARALLSARSR